MKTTLHVFHADEYLGDLIHDTDGDRYSYVQKSNSDMADLWNRITNADKEPSRFRETLLDTRVVPPDRIDLREILKLLGLFEYDPWKIMYKTNFTSDDMFWAREEMDPNWFWYNHPLASWHSRYTEVTGKPMYSQVVPVDDFSIY